MCYENHYKSYANVTIYFHTLIIPSSSLNVNGLTNIILICGWLPFSWIIVGDSSINMFLQVYVDAKRTSNLICQEWLSKTLMKNDFKKFHLISSHFLHSVFKWIKCIYCYLRYPFWYSFSECKIKRIKSFEIFYNNLSIFWYF